MSARPSLILALCSALLLTTAHASRLPEPVADAMDTAGLPAEALAYSILPLESDASPMGFQQRRVMQPASTMKLVTTIVALDSLGLNHRAKTELKIAGKQEGSVLHGDVYLVGGADPDLDWPAMWQLLRQLRESGIREVRGDVLLDRSLFKPVRADLGQPPFDEAPEFAYNVIPDALHLNGSLLDFRFQSDERTLRVSTSPIIDQLDVDTQGVSLTDTPCNDWESDWRLPQVTASGELRRIVFQGSFPKNCKVEEPLNLLERDWTAQKVITKLWRELGGSLRGTVKPGVAPGTAQWVATHRGRPLAEVIRNMNKQSDNAITRLVYLTMGANAACSLETTSECADAAVRKWLKRHEIDADGLVIENGSGLSRSERIQPRTMAEMLVRAWESQFADELKASLPIAGVDGTMRRRLTTSEAAGWSRLKTGTLSGVTGLAGYVRDGRGKYWAISAMINHQGSDAVANRKVLDTLIDWVASNNPETSLSPLRRDR
ncbi:D-alanyl-D-alanine carboxypeptidase/D-alanyl-D-alanine-endopeptidase [Chitinimonas sp. BJYL2]|uniref:D-alanyl-D-alanine carboxypeptidase/D-alanyl-D-alanine endopeptidase n=1 Tax=Chitinimonas sp. BJYL2 TaxID=2976696 RepID=UPI0022B3B64B|nr:D-alanyl-D-alanine carboxypeptidase/D-alanyl-D-alanine-endopeptidase [Chitinimonas sp. BJYL2]